MKTVTRAIFPCSASEHCRRLFSYERFTIWYKSYGPLLLLSLFVMCLFCYSVYCVYVHKRRNACLGFFATGLWFYGVSQGRGLVYFVIALGWSLLDEYTNLSFLVGV